MMLLYHSFVRIQHLTAKITAITTMVRMMDCVDMMYYTTEKTKRATDAANVLGLAYNPAMAITNVEAIRAMSSRAILFMGLLYIR